MKSSAVLTFSTLALCLLLALARTSSATASNSTGDKVKVDVYYETLCPDSQSFIIRKLMANYKEISSMITLNLIPFGKAEVYQFGDQTDFYCQHGSKECRGNMLHNCALADPKNNFTNVLRYIECSLFELYGRAKPNIDLVNKKCAGESDVNWERMEDCANPKKTKGKELLIEAGKKTKALRPKISFVPTIVLNGVYSTSNQQKAIYGDFVKLICDNYSGSKPKVCTSQEN